MRLLSVPVIFVSCATLKEPVEMLPPQPCVAAEVAYVATPSPTPEPPQFGCELEVQRLKSELREREFPSCEYSPCYCGDDGS